MADHHQHQHQHQQPPAHEKPSFVAAAPVSQSWHIAKITLGSLSLVLSIALVALSGATWSASGGWLSELSWTAPATVLAICWQTAEFVTLCARRRTPAGAFLRRGIHPGAHVALHLLCWLGFAAIVVVDSYNISTLYILRERRGYLSGSYGWYASNFSVKSRYVLSDQYWAITLAALSLASILLIIHFTLFVRACIETHHRSSASRSVQVVYVQQPPAAQYQTAGPGYYNGQYASPPQQQQQQQQQYPVPGIQSPPPAHRDYSSGQHNDGDYDSK